MKKIGVGSVTFINERNKTMKEISGDEKNRTEGD